MGRKRGITYDKRRDRWFGRIRFDGIKYRTQDFDTEQEALDWYENKSMELYGYDRVNEPSLPPQEDSE